MLKMEIINPHILAEFERIKKELKEKDYIKPHMILNEDEQMLAHFIAVYEATKNIID
jgi:hypothetical protein